MRCGDSFCKIGGIKPHVVIHCTSVEFLPIYAFIYSIVLFP